MLDQIVWFQNPVSVFGYRFERVFCGGRLVTCSSGGQSRLVEEEDEILVCRTDPYGDPEFILRDPLDATGLFRDFAVLDYGRDERILAFADDNGTLTNGVITIDDRMERAVEREIRVDEAQSERNNDHMDQVELQGEPRGIWVLEIRKMNVLVRLWDAMQSDDTHAIEQMIGRTAEGIRFRDPHSPFGTDPLDLSPDDYTFGGDGYREFGKSLARTAAANRQDARRRARAVLCTLVNAELAAGTAARLGLGRPQDRELQMRLVPRDLRSALWLQFARAINGNKEYRRCEECGRFFEISSPEGARIDSRFCTTGCRSRNWKRRKAEQPDGK